MGFMGSGKSSAGRLVARTLGGRFVDTDRLVTENTGRKIPEIFADGGEALFRKEESRALHSLLGGAGLVVATGGGIVTVPGNNAALRQLGFVVWLSASEEVIWERVSRNQNRPLLQTENPKETIRSLLASRIPLYESVSDMKVDTTALTHAEVAKKICDGVLRRTA